MSWGGRWEASLQKPPPDLPPKGRGGRGTASPLCRRAVAVQVPAGGIALTRTPAPRQAPIPETRTGVMALCPRPQCVSSVLLCHLPLLTGGGKRDRVKHGAWGSGQGEAPSDMCLAGVRGGERSKFAYSIPNSKKRETYWMLYKLKSDLRDLGFPQSFR